MIAKPLILEDPPSNTSASKTKHHQILKDVANAPQYLMGSHDQNQLSKSNLLHQSDQKKNKAKSSHKNLNIKSENVITRGKIESGKKYPEEFLHVFRDQRSLTDQYAPLHKTPKKDKQDSIFLEDSKGILERKPSYPCQTFDAINSINIESEKPLNILKKKGSAKKLTIDLGKTKKLSRSKDSKIFHQNISTPESTRTHKKEIQNSLNLSVNSLNKSSSIKRDNFLMNGKGKLCAKIISCKLNETDFKSKHRLSTSRSPSTDKNLSRISQKKNFYLDMSRESSLSGRKSVKQISQNDHKKKSIDKNDELSLEKHLEKEDKIEKRKQKLFKKILQSFSVKKKPPTITTDFYHFDRVIGQGAFGKVFVGSSILFQDEEVAIKAIDKLVLNNETIKKRVLQEILILKKLNHKNVVKLLEVFENKKNMFLVMEYMQFGDLKKYMIERNQSFKEDDIKSIFRQILDGLNCVHSNNILHRDIKLENLLVDNKNNVKICDFGISTLVMPGRKMSEQSGTPAYMAPEIIKGIEYEGFHSDVWSLGIVLYSLLTGNLPFEADNTEQLTQNILNANFNKALIPGEDARDLIEKILKVNPKERITIENIYKHPWLTKNELLDSKNKSYGGFIQYHCDKKKAQTFEEDLLLKIEKCGFPREYIIRSLTKNNYGHINALYNIINVKKTDK